MLRPSHTYGPNIARHYRGYRPDLHDRIVSGALKDQAFKAGLDIGCGTGRSSEALATVCQQVIGVDKSEDMLSQTKPMENIDFRTGTADQLPVETETVDLVSLAGVLPYLDLALCVDEIRRVCRREARVLVYDFLVDLDALDAWVPDDVDGKDNKHDHTLNLSAHPSFLTRDVTSTSHPLTLTPSEASHLLLSSERRFANLADRFSTKDPFPILLEELSMSFPVIGLTAKSWAALHALKNSEG